MKHKLKLSPRWLISFLLLSISLTANAFLLIEGYSSVTNFSGYPLYNISSNQITISRIEGGGFDTVLVDGREIAYNYDEYWKSYTIDVSDYSDGEAHCILVGANQNITGGCYFIKNANFPFIDGIFYYVQGDEASVMGSQREIEVANILSECYYNGNYIPVTSIGNSAFQGCRQLTSISIPNSITSIGDDAFNYCTGLTSVKIPDFVSNIGIRAFYECSGITSITLPESITSIGEDAFIGYDIDLKEVVYNCSECICDNTKIFPKTISSLTIGKNVKKIPIGVFSSCPNLEKLYYYAYEADDLKESPFPDSLKTVIVGDGVSVIPDYMLNECSGLTLVSFPESLTTIGSYAFSNCSGLSSVIFPESLEIIKSGAFMDCSGLESIRIPDSLKKMDGLVFKNCTGLTEVSLGSSINFIGNGAFAGCLGITSITLPESLTLIGSDVFDASITFQKFVYNAKNLTNEWSQWSFPFSFSIKDLIIGENVETIPNLTFYRCSKIDSLYFNARNCESIGYSQFPSATMNLTIGEEVKKIPGGAFMNLSELTSVTIPKSVISIGENAFNECTGLEELFFNAESCTVCGSYSYQAFPATLKKLTIGDGVKVIPDYALGINNELDSIIIPKSVSEIGTSAFSGCTKLKTVYFNAQNLNKCDAPFPITLENLIIGNKVSTIPHESFFRCSNLTSLIIPESVKKIDYYAFLGCSGLKSVIFANSLENIGFNAFEGCYNLKDIVIPPSVNIIEANAFKDTRLQSIAIGYGLSLLAQKAFDISSLKNVYITAETPPKAYDDSFGDYTIPLWLTDESAMDNYMAAPTCWNMFTDKRLMTPIKSLKTNSRKINGKPGDKMKLEVEFEPSDATLTNLFFKTNRPDLVSVDYEGTVTFLAPDDEMENAGEDEPCTIEVSTMFENVPKLIIYVGDVQLPADNIILDKDSIDMKVGESFSLTATVLPEDTSDKTVVWSSSNDMIASVDSEGKVMALSLGEAKIIATCGSVSASCLINVIPTPVDSIAISQNELNIVEGDTEALTATVYPENATDRTVTWSTSDATVASVSEEGLVTAMGPGSATIFATSSNGLTATCIVSVTPKFIEVSEIILSTNELYLVEGDSAALTATVYPENATDKTVTWSTTDATVATVSEEGIVTAMGSGTATIFAASSNGLTVSCIVAVTPKFIEVSEITLSANELYLVEGDSAALTATVYPENATDKTITWSTTDATVATVTEEGIVTAMGSGTATIFAASSNGLTVSCMVAVTPKFIEVSEITLSANELYLVEGDSAALTATVYPENATDKTVTWSTTDATVATVTEEGIVTAIGSGTATIFAASSNGLTVSCMVAVTPKFIEVSEITLSTNELYLVEGDSAALTATVYPENATDKTVTWSTTDATVATVTEEGIVTAMGSGTATIFAASSNGLTATCFVSVSSNSIEPSEIILDFTSLDLVVGDVALLTATVYPENATDMTVTWSSSDSSVATVIDGTVWAMIEGETTITASTSNGLSASCVVTVTDHTKLVESVYIDPTSWSGEIGESIQLNAIVIPEDATNKSLTWMSTDYNVASVDSEGIVTINGIGTCCIVAWTLDGSNLNAECLITGVAGVEEIFSNPEATVDVFNMSGIMLKHDCNKEDVKQLLPGIYILRRSDAKTIIFVNR